MVAATLANTATWLTVLAPCWFESTTDVDAKVGSIDGPAIAVVGPDVGTPMSIFGVNVATRVLGASVFAADGEVVVTVVPKGSGDGELVSGRFVEDEEETVGRLVSREGVLALDALVGLKDGLMLTRVGSLVLVVAVLGIRVLRELDNAVGAAVGSGELVWMGRLVVGAIFGEGMFEGEEESV